MLIRGLFGVVLVVLIAFSSIGHSKEGGVDFVSASPVGSWQLREQITTNHKGKRSGNTIRTSMVGKEQRDGETHYWVEVAMQNFKISKKGKRKNKGKRVVMKSLMPESQFTADPENVLSNLRNFAVETIIQTGKEEPMRIPDTGGMLASAMQLSNVDIKFDFEPLGKETIRVQAGEFEANKSRGQGSTVVNAIIKKIRIKSDMINWYSNSVPFGLIKMEGTTTNNGKISNEVTELLEFASSGAESEITRPAKDMPQAPGLDGLFGGF